MIDDGILFDYKSDQTYAASLKRIRQRLCTARGNFLVLDDRINNAMRRFAVAIFDERGNADIDVCLLGNTMYILGVRLAEHKWFVTAKQDKEFGSCGGAILRTLPFEGGYGALGIIGGQGMERFRREHASVHVKSMKDYMLASAGGGSPGGELEARCKLAFAFFAMTIAEAARFTCIETMMLHGGIDPPAVIPVLQSWVVHSSVRDANFPATDIAVAGIHEQRSGKVWPLVMKHLDSHPNDVPTIDDLAGTCAGTRAFLGKTGVFANSAQQSKAAIKRKERSGWQSGYEFLLDAYFRSRLDPQLIEKARAKFLRFHREGVEPQAVHLAGLTI